MGKIIENKKMWIDDVWSKIEKKVQRTATTTGDSCFAYTTRDGKFVNDNDADIPSWWTNGFWVGIMWLLYSETNNSLYKNVAESLENKLDAVIEDIEGLHHDVGFMWLLSSVANYKLTGNYKSKKRGLLVANILAGRFNSNGNFIRAWNCKKNSVNDNTGWAIIDCMMNIPLLYWASREISDPRFRQLATKHADTVMRHFVRPDGSVKHIVEFNPETGEYVKDFSGQGYEQGSSWTRGQAWALYGFALSYIHTEKQEYLDVAKQIAHYFIANLEDDFVPPCDFRSPEEPVYKDTTAGVCAASGLIEIAKVVPEFEKELYLKSAIKILKATEERYCDWSDTEDSIVQMGSEAYHFGNKNIPIIYGDYFFIEAILKLRGSDLLLW